MSSFDRVEVMKARFWALTFIFVFVIQPIQAQEFPSLEFVFGQLRNVFYSVIGKSSSERGLKRAEALNLSRPLPSAILRLLWLLRHIIKLERLTQLDEDIPDVSPFKTAKGIVSGKSQTDHKISVCNFPLTMPLAVLKGEMSGMSSFNRKLQERLPNNVPFPCDTNFTRSPMPPESVHKLRPGDIDIVAAMGDSLTAANGAAASRLIDVTIENRGLSWAIGGQGNWRQHLTIPNIIKEFNPNLIGYSLGDSQSYQRDSQFNVAEMGSVSRDMYYMAHVLVRRIKLDQRVDFKKHWKLVNIMIGANDFCLEFCYMSSEKFNKIHEIHRKQLTMTLDYLRDNLPRTLVNLVLVPTLEILHDLKGLSSICDNLHILLCPCLFGKLREPLYKKNIYMEKEWQRVQREVARDERYRIKPDFAVVLQPFTGHLIFPEVPSPNGPIADKTYLSEDCFHFSQKAYARAANALWNNMMEPVGNKTEDWTPTYSRFLCPTRQNPYIYTWANSS